MAFLSRFRPLRIAFISIALAAGGAYAGACDDSGGGSGGGPGDDDGGPSTLPDAAILPTDADAPATTMRLAHVAPDLGAVDFCYRTAKSTSFEGPVLGGGLGSIMRDGGEGGASDAGDAGASSLDATVVIDDAGDAALADAGAEAVVYRTVSRYLNLTAAGPLTIALVGPGATSCATPLFTADVTLDPGKLSTVAIVGSLDADGGDALSLVAFTDDRLTMPTKARVRMIHAALGKGALSVRASSSQTFSVAENLEPKKAASPSSTVPVDSLGYATIAPVPSPAQLAVGAAAGTMPASDASIDSWVSKAGELDLRGGSLHTGFVLSGDVSQPFEVLWCTDTSTSGNLTTCALVR